MNFLDWINSEAGNVTSSWEKMPATSWPIYPTPWELTEQSQRQDSERQVQRQKREWLLSKAWIRSGIHTHRLHVGRLIFINKSAVFAVGLFSIRFDWNLIEGIISHWFFSSNTRWKACIPELAIKSCIFKSQLFAMQRNNQVMIVNIYIWWLDIDFFYGSNLSSVTVHWCVLEESGVWYCSRW